MNILILEDSISHQVRIEKALREIAVTYQLPIFVKVTGKISEFEHYIEQDEFNQLYFLDLDIKGNEKKGLEIAQKIRDKNPYAIIVFVTTYSEAAPLTFKYKVSARDFIDKSMNDDEFKEKIFENVDYAFKVLKTDHSGIDIFKYSYRNRSISLPYHEIFYITTTSSHKLGLVGKNLKKEFYGILEEIIQQDKTQHFLKVNRSYIVNLDNVLEYDRKRKEVVFPNDIRCPISRLHVRKLLDTLEEREKLTN